MFAKPGKYYPVQGTNKFETVSFPITKAFRINLAGSTVGSNALFYLPAGTVVLGFYGKMVEALASSSVATFQIGFTGVTGMLTAATGSTTATVNAIITTANSTDSSFVHRETYILTAQDSFDCIIATDPISTAGTGKIDVFLTYVPGITEAITTSEFPVYSF